ncbi:hypothetical protein EDB92DRAFT_1829147 [Lactarius akahatsu]|uniref:Uncharacterized protein n=1 Tax=Lactarius akahatsu TaxID=416441 RepID=A0AAD4QHH2_9AGAM|nr:hypothetical protein EDB92DRAFT_1829147 [Lactarius akahatsu]
MKSNHLILAVTSLLAAAVHGSVIKVESNLWATGSVQTPSGTASVSFSASCASGTPGKQRRVALHRRTHTEYNVPAGCDNKSSGIASTPTPTIINSIESVPASLNLHGVPPYMISSGIPSGLPNGTPLTSTFTPEATYTGGTVPA